eukprot:TRINITY_DN3242_c0_g1_i10.p2 TRINITY_DN3242_c0_g1~~TRINITY_DN3242_c0_g1_i10.p2  ORF type:complete len:262 (-),score=-28.38 TRINITY_DN3242_c0_g1_i10:392-1177(-)
MYMYVLLHIYICALISSLFLFQMACFLFSIIVKIIKKYIQNNQQVFRIVGTFLLEEEVERLITIEACNVYLYMVTRVEFWKIAECFIPSIQRTILSRIKLYFRMNKFNLSKKNCLSIIVDTKYPQYFSPIFQSTLSNLFNSKIYVFICLVLNFWDEHQYIMYTYWLVSNNSVFYKFLFCIYMHSLVNFVGIPQQNILQFLIRSQKISQIFYIRNFSIMIIIISIQWYVLQEVCQHCYCLFYSMHQKTYQIKKIVKSVLLIM